MVPTTSGMCSLPPSSALRTMSPMRIASSGTPRSAASTAASIAFGSRPEICRFSAVDVSGSVQRADQRSRAQSRALRVELKRDAAGRLPERRARHQGGQIRVGERDARLRRQSRRRGAEFDLRRQTSFGQAALDLLQRDGRRLESHAAVQLASGDARHEGGARHREGDPAIEIIEKFRREGFRRPRAAARRRNRASDRDRDHRRGIERIGIDPPFDPRRMSEHEADLPFDGRARDPSVERIEGQLVAVDRKPRARASPAWRRPDRGAAAAHRPRRMSHRGRHAGARRRDAACPWRRRRVARCRTWHRREGLRRPARSPSGRTAPAGDRRRQTDRAP